jgi:acetyl-CoA C-acetyltransferase
LLLFFKKEGLLSLISADRLPVIAGIGEITDRAENLLLAKEPLALMAEAMRRADADAGGGLLARIDSIDVVNLVSWRYADPAKELSVSLGITPARGAYGAVGGESPVRFIHEAALRIARGEITCAAVCGAEAAHSVARARKTGAALPWTAFAADAPAPVRGSDIVHPLAARLGVSSPVTVYPFYEVACAASWGQTPREAQAESGALWARYAAVAANNPYSWLPQPASATEIVTPGRENRLVAWPYTKLMVANPMVNQGAAVLLTSLGQARRAGIAGTKLVHVWGGAYANEPRDFLARDQYQRSHAQDVVLQEAMRIAGDDFDAMELYSCFPCVPKMARRSMGLGADVNPTVTGGLTFFGAPLNNFMTHAACAMVRRIRNGARRGLLYGQGEFVTKHHALVVGAMPPAAPVPSWPADLQAAADAKRAKVPTLDESPTGLASLESFTILYERDGSVRHGVVMLRTRTGGRTLAMVPADDPETLSFLTNVSRSPVGVYGVVGAAENAPPTWRVESRDGLYNLEAKA